MDPNFRICEHATTQDVVDKAMTTVREALSKDECLLELLFTVGYTQFLLMRLFTQGNLFAQHQIYESFGETMLPTTKQLYDQIKELEPFLAKRGGEFYADIVADLDKLKGSIN